MRTKTLLLSAVALAAGLLSSQAQSNVYSANVVGYVTKTFAGAGKYSMVANPLDTPTNTLSGVFGTSLPNGTQVLKFDPNIGDYVTYTRVAFGNGWSPAAGATATFAPGEGVIIKTPAASADLTNTFVGTVLQANPNPLTNSFAAGYKLTGDLVPLSGAVTNAAIQLTGVPNGSQILIFDANIQDFATYTKVAFGSGWSPSVPTINVGDGFFMKAAAPFNWVSTFVVQ